MNTSKETMIAYLQLMRLHKPIGTFLLMWPTLWALQIAFMHRTIDWKIVMIFLLGVFIMRAAGCVINDIFDRDFDLHVRRTYYRPLPSNKISVTQALIVFFILLSCAFILLLMLHPLTQLLAVGAAGIIVIYPLMKRYIKGPQIIFSIAFSWGILMVFAEVQNQIPLEAWLLFLANMCWGIAYDTMYAITDREDDLKIGVKSTAIWFGPLDRLIIFILQCVMLFLLFAVGLLLNLSQFYFFSFAFLVLDILYQQYLIKDRAPALCFKAFMHNNFFGALVFLALLMG